MVASRIYNNRQPNLVYCGYALEPGLLCLSSTYVPRHISIVTESA